MNGEKKKDPTINLTVIFVFVAISLQKLSFTKLFSSLVNERVSASPWIKFNVCVYTCVSIFHLRDHKTLCSVHAACLSGFVFFFVSFCVRCVYIIFFRVVQFYLCHRIPWMLAARHLIVYNVQCTYMWRYKFSQRTFFSNNSWMLGALLLSLITPNTQYFRSRSVFASLWDICSVFMVYTVCDSYMYHSQLNLRKK